MSNLRGTLDSMLYVRFAPHNCLLSQKSSEGILISYR